MGVNKKLNQEDIQQFVKDDLVTKIKTDKAELERLRFNHSVSSSGNPASITAKRRDVARLLTELKRRALAEKKAS